MTDNGTIFSYYDAKMGLKGGWGYINYPFNICLRLKIIDAIYKLNIKECVISNWNLCIVIIWTDQVSLIKTNQCENR